MKKTAILFFLISACLSSLAAAPNTPEELWKNYDARKDPLRVEVVREWVKGTGRYKLIRYSAGVLEGSNKTAEPMIAAYYGVPNKASKERPVPALVQLHGGGQRAELHDYWVEAGYAVISINWGAKALDEKGAPNTDWNGLAAGFIGSNDEKHWNDITPGPNTLYSEPHPMNSSWMLIAVAARRALTFLEQQPEVDADKLGVFGHSMGGRSTVHSAIDPRVKAACPSVGGSGFLYEDLWGLPGSARNMRENLDAYQKTVSAQSYWPLIKCPILFLGAANDFNSPTECVIKGMSLLPSTTNARLALAPHLNHRFTPETYAARVLWFESILKGSFDFPQTAKRELILKTGDGIPVFKVWPDESVGSPLKKVDVYYGYARDPRIRFLRDGMAIKVGDHWEARCPVFDTGEPLFVFANITYDIGHELPLPPGYTSTRELSFTSEYQSALPEALQAAGVRPTEKPQRMIDDFSRGWQDWYRLSADNPQHWVYATRKVLDPSWIGPKDGKLAFEIAVTEPGNKLGVTCVMNEWQSYTGRRKDTFVAVVKLEKSGTNSVALAASDFKNKDGVGMEDWDEITDLQFQPANKAVSGEKSLVHWKGAPPALANLRWEGGTYVNRPHPHQPRGSASAAGRLLFTDEFQTAITDSVKLEKQDAQQK